MQNRGHEHMPSIQVIIAALNEEEGIGQTIAELRNELAPLRVLVVDGRSTDRTVEIAKNMGADILLQEEIGKGNAIAKAIENSDLGVDYVVITDADYTYPAEYVPAMIRIMEDQPEVGMVCGYRFNNKDKHVMRHAFYFGNKVIALTHNLLNGVSLADPLTGLRVVRAQVLRNWTVKSKGFDIEVELNHHVARQGYTIMELPIKYRQRLGQKKLQVKHGAEILRRIMLESIY